MVGVALAERTGNLLPDIPPDDFVNHAHKQNISGKMNTPFLDLS
jgi:hypothetical protein